MNLRTLFATLFIMALAACAASQRGPNPIPGLQGNARIASKNAEVAAKPVGTVPPQSAGVTREPIAAASVRTLYAFKGGISGGGPQAKMTAVNGILYGTTHDGGLSGYGTVFRYNPSTAKYKVLYSFQGGYDGWGPAAALQYSNGLLYGTTSSAPEPGFPNGGGNGTVFSVTTSGAEHVLHSFTGTPDGANPEGFVRPLNGLLYGTTFVGGTGYCTYSSSSGCGTVFSVNPTTGAEKVIYSFQGSPDAAGPRTGLLVYNGNLIGTSYEGGQYGLGTVFSINPTTGTETVLYSFAGGSDGSRPQSALIRIGTQSLLYGTTDQGCVDGTVYSIDPSTGVKNVLACVNGGPEGGLVLYSNTFYGTTSGDGSATSGSIFSVSLSGTENVLYQFTGGTNGGSPEDALNNINGTFYGTTRLGGTYGVGTIFRFVP